MNTDNLAIFAKNIINILNKGNKGKTIPTLKPCQVCGQQLVTTQMIAITILDCGCIYHRTCIEKVISYTKASKCPECNKDTEPFEITPDEPKNTPGEKLSSHENQQKDIMIVDPPIGQSPESLTPGNFPLSTAETTSRKRSHGDDETVKKAKKAKVYTIVKNLIDELNECKDLQHDSSNTTTGEHLDMTKPETLVRLYGAITNAEYQHDKSSQDVIQSYYDFGLCLSELYKIHSKSHPPHTATILVNRDIREQLGKDVSETALWKKTERARKIQLLFDRIGMNKIKRVRTFSASTISKLTWPDIDYVVLSTLIRGNKSPDFLTSSVMYHIDDHNYITINANQ